MKDEVIPSVDIIVASLVTFELDHLKGLLQSTSNQFKGMVTLYPSFLTPTQLEHIVAILELNLIEYLQAQAPNRLPPKLEEILLHCLALIEERG
ncbi:MAG: hypothetical protein M3R06_05095 [Chloroflexota bacterium]|nr:hypothetical protein [Chloroflexota bacterium]